MPGRPRPATGGAGFPWRHALLALAVVAVWGSNFVVIRWALDVFSPLWLATLRFTLALAPVLLGVAGWSALAKPSMRWRDLLLYGAFIGAGQFALLYLAMQGHISPGLASLVIQTQVFFTIGLAMLTAGERLQPFQMFALALAAAGLVVIAAHTHAPAAGAPIAQAAGAVTTEAGVASAVEPTAGAVTAAVPGAVTPSAAPGAAMATTPRGVLMVLAAAACWAAGNIVGRRSAGASALAVVVWGNLGAVPLLALLAWSIEGPQALREGIARADAGAWAAVAWQALGNTLFGYTAWGWLMRRHPAATVAPWALLVPVFGMASSALLLAEPLPGWKLGAAALVLAGLALNLGWPRLRARLRRTHPDV